MSRGVTFADDLEEYAEDGYGGGGGYGDYDDFYDGTEDDGTTTEGAAAGAFPEEAIGDDIRDGETRTASQQLQQEQEEASRRAASAGSQSPSQQWTQQQQHQQSFPGASSSSSSSKPQCLNCGSHEIEQIPATGQSVCTVCGVVAEENAIVSSVEFVEGAGGASSMVGQFVAQGSSKAYTGGGGGGGRYGFSRDSRETTLANGRRKIQEVASRLRLGPQYVDVAHRWFTVAVERNFVQGRRTMHVVAACLYIACRQQKSQHMLIDFSDAVEVNVYQLGTCFLKFRRLLGLKLETIDPAFYVYRFAQHMDLDDKANAVAMTAQRLIARMKRDWMVAGRRPAGICAAALLISARAHGFGQHRQDVTTILRVCGLTINKRLKEFRNTPAASLTLDQFHDRAEDLTEEVDPPIYTHNKIMEARAKAIKEGNLALLQSGALDDPMKEGKRAHKWRDTELTERKVKFRKLYQNLDQELSQSQPSDETATNNNDVDNDVDNDQNDVNNDQDDVDNDNDQANGQAEEEDQEEHANPEQGEEPAKAQQQTQLVAARPSEAEDAAGELAATIPENWKDAYPKGRHGRAIILPDHATEEERRESVAPVEGKLDFERWKASLPEYVDEEIDGMFRDDEEERQKEAIFNKINKDYLVQQGRKETERLQAEAATQGRLEGDAAQAEEHARYHKRGAKSRQDGAADATTEAQLLAAVKNRKISRKINYDALSSLFDDDGTFSTDAVSSAAAGGDSAGFVDAASEDPMYGAL